MKTALIAIAMLAAVPASAQTTQYFGSDGSYQGSAIGNGGNTQYFGSDGSYQGSATTSGGTTQYFGSDGSYQGQGIQ